MVWIVKIVGILLIVYGCFLILRPDTLKKMIADVREGNKLYYCAGIKILIGILLIFASSSCRIPWIVLFLGSISVFGPIVSLSLKKQFLEDMLKWWETCDQKYIYMSGGISLLLGALLALAA